MINKRNWVIKVLEKNKKVLIRELISAYADVFNVKISNARNSIKEMVKLEIIKTDTKYLFLKEESK